MYSPRHVTVRMSRLDAVVHGGGDNPFDPYFNPVSGSHFPIIIKHSKHLIWFLSDITYLRVYAHCLLLYSLKALPSTSGGTLG